jgi:hypothetical protein
VLREPVWWAAALGGIARALRERRPLSWPAYQQWLRLPDVGRPTGAEPAVKDAPAAAESLV